MGDGKLILDETSRVDASDLADISTCFSSNLDGSIYAGGEAFDHGSYGFFYKMTNEKVDWMLISLEGGPFVEAHHRGNDIAFRSSNSSTWVVPGGQICKTFILKE